MRKPPIEKSLATTNSDLAMEWHPTLNGILTPYDFTAGSGRKVWWKCKKGNDHEWEATINSRNKQGHGCPICSGRIAVKSNSLGTLYPELAKQWHPTKNKLSVFETRPNSGKKVWWKCNKGPDHEWEAAPDTRHRNQSCPICTGQKVVASNSLYTLRPDLIEQWDYSKNTVDPKEVPVGTSRKVWWSCPKNIEHTYLASINHRNNGTGCPFCRGLKTCTSESLFHLYPELMTEWDYSKNLKVDPKKIAPFSNKKVWWTCSKSDDHIWQSSPGVRIKQNQGCPACAGRMVVKSNSMNTTHPKLAKELHPTKNGKINSTNIIAGTTKKLWWQCQRNEEHIWKVSGNIRVTHETECPFCKLTPQSRQELTITFELIQFFEINPRGFKTFIDGKMWSIDIYIKELNLGLEFDGNYWHKGNREFDKLKTEQLEDIGFKIIRIREEPLKKIFETDIISKKPYNGKEITNNVLKHIIANYNISNSRLNKIRKYIAKKTIQNQQALDEYIEKILIEKAENKKNKKTQYNNGYK